MQYDLQSHLDKAYSTFPEAKRKPIIGITTDYMNGDVALRNVYYKQMVAAGGVPMLISPVADKDVLISTLDHLDGLLLTGGADINPLWLGEEPSPKLNDINAERDLPELMLIRLAFNRQLPILGICRGTQALAVALGGKIQQDIYDEYIREEKTVERKLSKDKTVTTYHAATLKHLQDVGRCEATHSVTLNKSSVLYALYKEERLTVDSFHRQAVKDAGKHFRATALSPDEVIEAIEGSGFKLIMGMQRHPEWMGEERGKVLQWLVGQSNNFYLTKQLHQRILTLDTHCNTSMFFPQGVNLDQRDSRILYDLRKMTEGGQNAVTMVTYLPQPKIGESFSSKIDVEGLKRCNPHLVETLNHLSPAVYANLIFDKVEEIVRQNQRYISIARTPSSLYEDRRKGHKSIMSAIKNDLALEHKLEGVKHFAQRGVTCITLCHSGDNDICDFARGCNTHGGVSKFGEEVIKEMNCNDIVVGLSHGGEKSFYDALEISMIPVVCSHSNSKALCDIPRNFTDDQIRALAKRGGVAHITMYQGFLKKGSKATVMDAIAHLEHAINIMGIDHVSIGADFDGDGTVRGMAGASEMINFTLHLLRRKYSERGIEKM